MSTAFSKFRWRYFVNCRIVNVSHRFFSINDAKSNESLSELRVEKLKKRSLLTIEGDEAGNFLQGLITNDIRVFDFGSVSLFTMFLNAKGRIIHEAIVYKSNGIYFLESDISATQALQMHLKMYKLKKKVEIRNVEHELSVWAIFDPHFDPNQVENHSYSRLEGVHLGDGVLLTKDPRLNALGFRALGPKTADIVGGIRANGLNVMRSSVPMYTMLRYQLGVGEGIEEIPYGKYLVLEANGDYLNGINLKKAGFVGHELMFTEGEGKRLMPVIFESDPSMGFLVNSPIEDVMGRRKTPLGYLMGLQGRVGLGLMRVTEAMASGTVKLKNVLAHCVKPYWWPGEERSIQLGNN